MFYSSLVRLSTVAYPSKFCTFMCDGLEVWWLRNRLLVSAVLHFVCVTHCCSGSLSVNINNGFCWSTTLTSWGHFLSANWIHSKEDHPFFILPVYLCSGKSLTYCLWVFWRGLFCLSRWWIPPIVVWLAITFWTTKIMEVKNWWHYPRIATFIIHIRYLLYIWTYVHD